MAEMREAAPQRITLVESNPAPKKTKFETCINYAKKTGRVKLLPLIAAGAIVACTPHGHQNADNPTEIALTPGVNVVQMTPTGAPIETATIADFLSPTAKARATKTAQPTQTPEATATTEVKNLSHPYQIELSDQLKGMQERGEKLRCGLTPEEFKQQFAEDLAKNPQVGDLKFKLFIPTEEQVKNGQNSNYYYGLENGGPLILLNVDPPLKEIIFKQGKHEKWHFRGDLKYWHTVLPEEKYNQLAKIVNKTTYDPLTGLSTDQDPFTEYFNSKMLVANDYLDPDASIETKRATSRRRMIGIELSGLSVPSDKVDNPFLALVQEQLDEIQTYANSPDMRGKIDYSPSATNILDQNQAIVDRIIAQNPLMAKVYADIRANANILTAENLQITTNSGSQFRMSSPFKGETFEQLSRWGAVIFLEKDFKAGDPIIIKAYKDKLPAINQYIEEKDNLARAEGFADAGKVAEITQDQSLPAYEVEEFFKGIELQSSH